MCLIILAWRPRDNLPLVVAANRDEFHARPSVPAHFWPDQPSLLAGRDLSAGGTWMGVTREGRFAALTNFRDPARSQPRERSRGELAVEFLCSDLAPSEYLRRLGPRADAYAGFNLLAGTPGELACYSNCAAPENALQILSPGIYGLSNALLDTPWPKVVEGRRALGQVLADGAPPDHASLRAVVSDRRPAPASALHPLGQTETMDRTLSAQFILTPTYGTRATTTLWLSGTDDGALTGDWCEVSFDAEGRESGRCEWRFAAAGGTVS
ncbi:NRDE family protein [Haliea atlantica]|jgi:uncharacterized protein with NRDE domain|tara:strand:+ start:50296 stop:51099 length:804 start_codon:yes stop_codon:yes gene_type:complete